VLLGIQTQLLNSPGAEVDDGKNVIFDTTINDQTPSISYDATTGEFNIIASGNYFVTWRVTVDGIEGPNYVAFAIKIDGAGAIIDNAPTVTGQINGSAFITVTTVPVVLTLVNATGTAALLASTDVQANMVIMHLFP